MVVFASNDFRLSLRTKSILIISTLMRIKVHIMPKWLDCHIFSHLEIFSLLCQNWNLLMYSKNGGDWVVHVNYNYKYLSQSTSFFISTLILEICFQIKRNYFFAVYLCAIEFLSLKILIGFSLFDFGGCNLIGLVSRWSYLNIPLKKRKICFIRSTNRLLISIIHVSTLDPECRDLIIFAGR